MTSRKRRTREPSAEINFLIEDARWRRALLLPRLRKAARAALQHAGEGGSCNILLTSDARLKTLNRDFRGRNKPTNVLSFPSADAALGLGDIALAYGVTAEEAKTARKSFANHAMHLIVHGILHLLGYDHVRSRDAATMEALEIAILAELGVPDPYQTRARVKAA